MYGIAVSFVKHKNYSIITGILDLVALDSAKPVMDFPAEAF